MNTQLKTQKYKFNTDGVSGNIGIVLAPQYINFMANQNLKTCQNPKLVKQFREIIQDMMNESSKNRSNVLEFCYSKLKKHVNEYHIKNNTNQKPLAEAMQ